MIAACLSLGALLLLVYAPPVQSVFRTVPLSAGDLLFVLLLSCTLLVLDALRKRYFPELFCEHAAGARQGSVQSKKREDEKEAFSV